MPDCEHCGEALTNLAFDCNYCGQVNCTAHRLPETHDCVALHLALPPGHIQRDANTVGSVDSDTQNMRETLQDEAPGISEERIDSIVENVVSELDDPSERSYTVFDPELTVGTPDEIEYASSPDLNPDGSLATNDQEAASQQEVSGSAWGRYVLVLVLASLVAFGLYLFL